MFRRLLEPFQRDMAEKGGSLHSFWLEASYLLGPWDYGVSIVDNPRAVFEFWKNKMNQEK